MMQSMRANISLWLSLAILAVAGIAGAGAYVATFSQARAFQDNVLRQVVTLFDRQHLPAAPDAYVGKLAKVDEDFGMFVQVFTPASTRSAVPAATGPRLPENLHEGMQTIRIGKDLYRTYVRTLATGEKVAAAQDTDVRDDFAANTAMLTLLPFAVLVPLLLIVVAVLTRKMFKPVADVAIELDRRSEQELHAIPADTLPAEIQPFIIAINRLFTRIEQSIKMQQRFVVDAAHELRSPLTALSLQAEQLASAEMSDNARVRLSTLRSGISRGRALLEQLLTLARAQSDIQSKDDAVSIQKVLRKSLEDLMPIVESKSIDIGMNTEADAKLNISAIDLSVLMKNLLDNAVKYTPQGGRVDISIIDCEAMAEVNIEDSGPGISDEDKIRVFDPFFRVLGSDVTGSGLGLSIVKTIAERSGAIVTLHDATKSGSGLRVSTAFPKVSPVSS